MAFRNTAQPAPPALRFSRRLGVAIAICGILVTGYLSFLHLTSSSALCLAHSGCDTVRQSSYADIRGVPIALLGLLSFIAIFFGLALEDALPSYGSEAVLFISLTGTLYSAYLTYLELFVINAICPYCMASAILMTATLVIAIYRSPSVRDILQS